MRNPIDRSKAAVAKPLAKQFMRSEWAEAITTVWGHTERELAGAVGGLHEALGSDHAITVDAPEARALEIREAAEAIMAGDLEAHYLAEYTDVLNADRAVRYLGLDDAEWDEARSEWVHGYRKRGVEIDAERLVDRHITKQFGVDRETFEALVVGWDEEHTERAMREILLGPLDDVREAIELATEIVQEREDA